MHHFSTAFLIITLVIIVNQDGATAQFYNYDKTDQVAQEGKNRAVTIIDGPKYVPPPQTSPPQATANQKPERRLPSKPPNAALDKHGKPKYVETPRVYNLPPLRHHYSKQLKLQYAPNSIYKYHKVIPLPPHRNHYYPKQQSLVFAASTNKPSFAGKGPKYNVPVETVNGIRSDFVRPPHFANSTTSTTTAATTTTRYLRTKRIWPKRMLNKINTAHNSTKSKTNNTGTDEDLQVSSSDHRYVYVNNTVTTTAHPSTPRAYVRVTRAPRKTTTTPAPENITRFEQNDWVPIIPAHFPPKKVRKFKQTPINRRSDMFLFNPSENPEASNRMYYLHSYGLVPVASSQSPSVVRKNIIVVGNRGRKQLNTHVYSGYRRKPGIHSSHVSGDYHSEASHPPKMITKIKHHHHHHHHKYIKTVDKPYKVEVPKPVPVPVPMPVPVRVEKRVPYPVPVKVPHPIPVKVIEKEYVPKPYPVFQQVVKHVQVPVQVEKRVPYPVQVQVPVNKPYPVAVPYEKRVPYPVPVRVLVPQPYPVETKVPYPVEVKEPVEVIRHVHVEVPVPQPYPVKTPYPVPVTVEKKIPYPVEVEKKIPVPFRVLVPEKVEVEKKVPVYIPRPYPVEKKVPVPVKVPYPVRVPIRVPYGVPIFVHPSPNSEEQVSGHFANGDAGKNQHHTHYSYGVQGNLATNSPQQTVTIHGNSATDIPHHSVTVHGNTVTSNPHHTVTVHGKPGYAGFQSRSDVGEETTASNSVTAFTDTSNIVANTNSVTSSEITGTTGYISTVALTTVDPR